MREPQVEHFSGQLLWGDDFSESEREEWFSDEENAYLNLYASSLQYEYEYHGINSLLGFNNLPEGRRFERALGIGSAFGDELIPIADRVMDVIIVESSDHYAGEHLLPFPVRWRKAQSSGDLPLMDGEVDLVVCLGVLHHLPNVSHVVAEIGRVLAPGGYALIREPIISMGDWREPRKGLTPRERGIPQRLLLDYCRISGLEIVAERLCFFPGSSPIARFLRRDRFNDPFMIRLDSVLSRLTRKNYCYHATSLWRKARPTSVFLTLRRCAN